MSKGYVCTLSPATKEKAKTELNEKEDWRDRDIDALRDVILQNKALTCRTDPEFLLRFLRARKFDYDRSYTMLENYFKIRAENPQYFKNLAPSKVKHVYDDGVTQVLPKPDKEGRRIIYFRPGKWNPEKYSVFDILQGNVINMEMIVREEESQVHGVVFMGDMEGMGWDHVKNISREYFRLMTSVMQDSFPLRMKAMAAVNEPGLFQHIFALLRPFLKDKMKSRLHFHGSNIKKLQDLIDKECLPEELGGSLPHGDVLAKEWAKTVAASEAHFVEMQKYKIDLPRNIAKQTTAAASDVDAAGVTGTFRKLNVD